MGAFYSVQPKTKYWPDVEGTLQSNLNGQIIAITGCTTGTGYCEAMYAAKSGARVLMLNRPSERATAAETSIRMTLENGTTGTVETIACDLMDFESVRQAAQLVTQAVGENGLDALVCNAGIMATPDEATKDGYDTQMQTNHLSHFLLVKELMPVLEKAANTGTKGEARIVNMTSMARLGPPLEAKYLGKNGGSLGGDQTGFGFSGPRWERYHQTKLANCVFTYALYDKLQAKSSKVKVLLAHPGLAATNLQATTHGTGGMPTLFGPVYYFMAQSQEDGAAPVIQCFAGKSDDIQSGQFYGPVLQGGLFGPPALIEPEDICTDAAAKEMLWKESEAAVGTFVL
jgi:NAD(P)-dependent dehydrogenase (short-subunit alcohol dehydrogenase family)